MAPQFNRAPARIGGGPVPTERETGLNEGPEVPIYVDTARDFVGIYFSTDGYIPPYGEDKMPGYLRRATKMLAGD